MQWLVRRGTGTTPLASDLACEFGTRGVARGAVRSRLDRYMCLLPPVRRNGHVATSPESQPRMLPSSDLSAQPRRFERRHALGSLKRS